MYLLHFCNECESGMLAFVKGLTNAGRSGRILASFLMLPFLDGSSITLSWLANDEPDLAGYRIYYGKASRQYDKIIEVGRDTSFKITGLEPGQRYYIALTAVDLAGNESGFSEEVVAQIPDVGDGEEDETESDSTAFEDKAYNYPNPFNSLQEVTTIRYVLEEETEVTIEIFDQESRLVKTIAEKQFRSAGEHREDLWDGRNSDGNYVASGIYFCRIRARGRERFIKIAVMR